MAYKFDKLSVLVVEDIQPMLDVTVNTLKFLGVGNVYSATDPEVAFGLFQKYKPDLVITDWEMEPVDGIEFLRWIRRNLLSANRMVPVIMMTGYAAQIRVAEARDVGVTEFLVKPFTASELVRRLTHVIDAPRDFVETAEFFGPDRRRRRDTQFEGGDRRENEDV